MPQFEHSPSDRMQVIGRGDLRFPGTCMHCGSGSCDEGYIELDVNYEYEGDQYLCMLCTHQLVELVGSIHPDDFIKFMTEHAQLQIDLNKASEQLAEANERLSTYDSLFASVSPSVDSISSGPLEDVVEGEREDRQQLNLFEQDVANGEPESQEPVTNSGPDESNGNAASDTRPRRSFNL